MQKRLKKCIQVVHPGEKRRTLEAFLSWQFYLLDPWVKKITDFQFSFAAVRNTSFFSPTAWNMDVIFGAMSAILY